MSSDVPAFLPSSFHGRVETPTIESEALRGNRAGDGHVRELPIYLPPGWDSSDAQYPVVVLLAAFTGRPHAFLETHPWRRGLVSYYDELVHAGQMPPAILVMPDGFTGLGGAQWIDSTYNGNYATHVTDEVLPIVHANYPTRPGPCAVAGKSSGGFGALRFGMSHPELFGAVASVSGDAAFELSLAPELSACLRGLIRHGGDPQRFLEAFGRDPDLSGDGHAVINVLAMAACYSPNPDAPLGFDLPMDLETGERIDAVWRRWLAHDPLQLVETHVDALKKLRLLHVECGLRDEFHLQWAARQLSKKLTSLDVPHAHEEHDGGHRGLDPRLLALIPKLVSALE